MRENRVENAPPKEGCSSWKMRLLKKVLQVGGGGGGGGGDAVHEGSEATLGPPQELEVRARSAPNF
jgi:hypothetical protein